MRLPASLRFLTLSFGCMLVAFLASCDEPRFADVPDDGRTLAEQLRADAKQSDSYEVELRLWVILEGEENDPRRFRLKVESNPEVGQVLHGFELSVNLFEGLLNDDGDLLLIITSTRLTGQRELVAGNLHDVASGLDSEIAQSPVALFISRLPMIVQEIASGPVPDCERYHIIASDDGSTILRCVDDDSEVHCTLDPTNERVISKTVFVREDDGLRELATLNYRQYLAMDNLLRPRDIGITLAEDPTRLRVKISTLEQTSIDDQPKLPEPPGDLPLVELGMWLESFLTAEPTAQTEQPTAPPIEPIDSERQPANPPEPDCELPLPPEPAAP